MLSNAAATLKWTASRITMAAALAACLCPSAQAGLITFAPQGSGTTYVTSGFGFGGGNALAVSAVPLSVGSTFTLYYQSHLTSLVGVNAVTGLNTAFQITEVAALKEVVTSLVPNGAGGTTATFALVPGAGNVVSIYENNAVTFNDSTGAGFHDGTLIASLNPTSFTLSQFATSAGLQTYNSTGLPGDSPTSGMAVIGTGSTGINLGVTSSLSNFFITQPLVSSIFNSNLASAFDTVAPSTTFFNPVTSREHHPQPRGGQRTQRPGHPAPGLRHHPVVHHRRHPRAGLGRHDPDRLRGCRCRLVRRPSPQGPGLIDPMASV